ncbi:MAG: Acg family FMN-binding oxidoreductase, partial [Tabrizicola sp.]
MTLSRRKTLALIGGGVILAATASLGAIATRQPRTALLPWGEAGRGEDARHRALSWALLAPNPHNRQPWLVDLREDGVVTLYVDTAKLLPHTDPFSRQITIGLGCFLELMRMAATHDGYRVEITPFPEGFDDRALDARPVARAVFSADAGVTPDPLFAHALARRSNKEPYDLTRSLPEDTLQKLAVAKTARFGGTLDATEVAAWRAFTHEALRIEIETPHTYKESVDLFRIGRVEVDANPDGIDFTGPLFEVLGATGLMTRESVLDTSSQAYKAGLDAVYANTDTAMGHVWLVTDGNSRPDQIATGADWLRVNLAATAAGVAFQPLSQALQEYPEMAKLYADLHARLAPKGGTVQMLARIGYGPEVAPSPRWPLEAKILN